MIGKRVNWMAVALVSSMILGACSQGPEEATEPVVPVQVSKARTESIQRVITADGILRALDQSAITPKINSPVNEFFVNRGDHVSRGQLLATLENSDLAAAVTDAKGAYEQAAAEYRNISSASVPDELAKAVADVAAAQQSLEAEKKLLDSRQQLYGEGAISRRLVDEASVSYAQAKSQYDTAQRHLDSLRSVGREEVIKSAAAQMESAKGRYDAAQAQLSYSEIRSPISGVVADRALFPGEMASAGTPLLTVMNISSLIARVNLPQEQAAYVRLGQSARITETDNSAEVHGKVTVVSPAIDPQSTTVEIWVQAPNPGERLRPGSTAQVSILADTIPDSVVVPVGALLPSSEGGAVVMVIGADSVAHERRVQVGVRNEDKAQILSGVAAGESVVTTGGLGLEDGAKVRVEKTGEAKG
jgi:HlyD family secretion protein